MKKISILVWLLLLAGLLYTQTIPQKAARATFKITTRQTFIPATYKTFATSPQRVSNELAHRIKRTYKQASHLESYLLGRTVLAAFRTNQAAQYLSHHLDIDLVKEIYPEMTPLLTTPKQFTYYFLVRNNREVLKHAPQEIERLTRMNQQIPVLRQHQQFVNHPPQQDAAWLAAQIPANTAYVLMGEVHDISQLHPPMAQFLAQLRKKFPVRPLLLLTEFLPEDTVFAGNNFPKEWYTHLDPSLISLWKQAKKLQITTIGLEPFYSLLPENDAKLVEVEKGFSIAGESIWSASEGLRLRNKHWLRLIQSYRKIYPDALIIIHAGFGHLGYTNTYSLGATLSSQAPTYIISFAPGETTPNPVVNFLQQQTHWLDRYPCPPDGFFPSTHFDLATQGAFAQRILKFAPQDRLITGFDIQLKIPVISQNKVE